MGQEKDRIIKREESQHDAAARDDRRCAFCGTIVPYGTNLGKHDECPSCVGALKD